MVACTIMHTYILQVGYVTNVYLNNHNKCCHSTSFRPHKVNSHSFSSFWFLNFNARLGTCTVDNTGHCKHFSHYRKPLIITSPENLKCACLSGSYTITLQAQINATTGRRVCWITCQVATPHNPAHSIRQVISRAGEDEKLNINFMWP